MDFKSFKETSKKLGMGGDYYKLQDGENKVRILTEPEPIFSHFSASGSTTCPGDLLCPICKAGGKKTAKIMLYIIDRTDNDIKLAEFGWSVYKALGELANSSEYGFSDLPPYDVIIKRTGEGKDTRYTTVPGRNEEPVSVSILEELKTKKPVKEIIISKIKRSSQPVHSEHFEEDLPDFLKEE